MLEQNGTCRQLCTASVPAEDAKFINDRIREDYALNWLIDGLPAAEMKWDMKTNDTFFDMGFNLGNDEEERFFAQPALNNHYDIVLRYHRPTDDDYRIVGVLVWPLRCAYSTILLTSPLISVVSATGAPSLYARTRTLVLWCSMNSPRVLFDTLIALPGNCLKLPGFVRHLRVGLRLMEVIGNAMGQLPPHI